MIRARFTSAISLLIALAWFGAANAQAPLGIGAAAPAFKLQDQNGQWHTLDEFKGKWLVL